jgi:hypothetical protein
LIAAAVSSIKGDQSWSMWVGQLSILAAGVGFVSFAKTKLDWDVEPSLPRLVHASLCLVGIGFLLACYEWGWSWSHQAARLWSRGVATIVRSERHFASFDIEFSFDVDGNAYNSIRVRFGLIPWVEQKAVVELYPVGRQVCVYFDPNVPVRSCLQTTGHPLELYACSTFGRAVLCYHSIRPVVALPIHHYDVDHVPNENPSGAVSWQLYHSVRNAVVEMSRNHGPTGPLGLRRILPDEEEAKMPWNSKKWDAIVLGDYVRRSERFRFGY